MALNLQDKKAIVAEVADVASKAITAVAADYRGLTVTQMTDLREKARNSGVYLRVVRNTLARRAVEGTSFECIQSELIGPLVLAFAEEDPGAPARLIRDFAKDNEHLQVKFLSIDGQLIEGKDIERLASLPTHEEALAKLMSVMKAPVTKFVQTLAAPHTKLVRTLAAVRDQKQSDS